MKNYLMLFLFMICGIAKSQQPAFNWVKTFGSDGGEHIEDVVVDGNGFVYGVGRFGTTVDFDPGPGVFTLTAVGQQDMFACKLDSSGNFIWAFQIGGTLTETINAIAIDASNNIYITGQFRGVVDFDPGANSFTMAPPAGGDEQIFAAKYSSNGNFIWAKHLGGTGDDKGISIEIDNTGMVVLAGEFATTGDFDPGPSTYTLLSNGYRDIYVAKLDAQGNLLWAKSFGGTNYDRCWDMAVSKSGNIAVTGDFDDSVDFDPGPAVFSYSTSNGYHAYINMLDAQGSYVKAVRFEGTAGSVGLGLAFDANDNLFTSGWFGDYGGPADFDPGPGVFNFFTSGVHDTYLVKLSPSLQFVWAKQITGSGAEYAWDVGIDPGGNLVACGWFNGTADLDPGTAVVSYSSASGAIAFIVILDNNGVYNWSGILTNTANIGHSNAWNMFVSQQARLYFAGSFGTTIDFDPGPGVFTLSAVPYSSVTNQAGDGYFLKLRLTCAAAQPVDSSKAWQKNVCNGMQGTLTAYGYGNFKWYSSPTSTTVIGTGTSFTTNPLPTGIYTYYVDNTTCTHNPVRTAITVTANSCLGIEENQGAPVALFPNPASDKVLVTVLNQNADILITDLLGRKFECEKTITATGIELNAAGLPEGLYLIQIRVNDKTVACRRLVIDH